MAYFNCGVLITGKPARSKKDIKAAVADNPAGVEFYGTAMNQEHIRYRANEIPAGVICSFVGPDPYTARKWYGSCTIKNDRVVVS